MLASMMPVSSWGASSLGSMTNSNTATPRNRTTRLSGSNGRARTRPSPRIARLKTLETLVNPSGNTPPLSAPQQFGTEHRRQAARHEAGERPRSNHSHGQFAEEDAGMHRTEHNGHRNQ